MKYCLVVFLSIMTFSFASEERVLGIGSSCMDFLIQLDEESLNALVPGEKGGCIATELSRIDQIIESHRSDVKIVPGGSVFNTLQVLSHLGMKTRFSSYAGTDADGQFFCRYVEELGIENRIKTAPDLSLVKVVALIAPNGERTFFDYDPVLRDATPSSEDFQNVSLLHLEARRLQQGDCIEKAMELARVHGAKISFNLSDFQVVNRYKERMLPLISKYVDILFCNEDEMRALSSLGPEEGARKMHESCPLVIVTLGEKGCLMAHDGIISYSPGFPANAIDTTGAGDYFEGGFLYGYLHEKPLSECAQMGNYLGAAIVEEIGAKLPSEKWEQVRQKLVGKIIGLWEPISP
jgi:sugar/nucleoside kinase (ribokinase family)